MTNHEGEDRREDDRRTQLLPVGALVLDAENPRLPEDLGEDDQRELIQFVAEHYDALQIAESLAQHGYFPSEPLTAIEVDDGYVVVEGNRRLSALKLLLDATLREDLDLGAPDRWDELAEEADLDGLREVPVDVRGGRDEVDPVLGFRHISGIEPWDPWAKARFIARMIERREEGFEAVASAIGERETDVRSHYRNYRITVQAGEEYGLDTDLVKHSFGVFTRAMQSPDLRDHIGAPAPRDIERNANPVPERRREELEELLEWLFGVPGDRSRRVISESRDINDLAQVMTSPEAIQILRETRDLEEAFVTAGGLLDRLTTRLTQARNNLRRAQEDIRDYRGEDEVENLLAECQEALEELQGLE